VKNASVVLCICCCLSVVSGQRLGTTPQPSAAPRPGFDPRDVVRQVRPARSGASSLDGGEFLIDTRGTLVPAQYTQDQPALAFDGQNFLVVWQDRRSGTSYDIYGTRVTSAGAVLDSTGIAISTAMYGQYCPVLAFDGENFLVVWEDERSGSDIYGARVTSAGAVLDTAGIAISAVSGNQSPEPAIAFGGENFLVVWRDARSSSSDIYGVRVTPGGDVLDTAGIAVSTATGTQSDPAVASDGGGCLVVWEDYRDNPDTCNIYGARVTPAGVVLDPAGIPVSTAACFQQEPAIASNGEDFLVVWEDGRSDVWESDVYGARVTPAGVVLDPTGITLSDAALFQSRPALAFDGENFFVAWQDNRSSYPHTYGTRVTPAGAVLDTAGIALSTVSWQESPAVASSGTSSLVAWADARGPDDIYGARVTSVGAVLDSIGIAISTATNSQNEPALAFDGENFLAVWEDWRGLSDICGARVSQSGQTLDTSCIAISTARSIQEEPAVAIGDGNYLVVWRDDRGLPSDIYGARVTPAGAVLDPQGIAVSTAASSQESPAVASDGESFFVIWDDYRGSSHDIYGARVTPAGMVRDPQGIAISTAAGSQAHPAIAFGGGCFLVVWEDHRGSSRDIYGARVTPAGAVLDKSGIAISSAADSQVSPAVVFDGADFLVVWRDCRSGSSGDIYGARVTPAGVVFDSGPVVRQEGSQEYPALALSTSSQMLLVYQGWAGSVGGKTYNTQRIWGMLDPNPGVAEGAGPTACRSRLTATIVRGVLFLPGASSVMRGASCVLLDISGRKVMDLRPGANDVRALAPGVYFVREGGESREQGGAGIRKVVIQR